jgi:hypothetical protein
MKTFTIEDICSWSPCYDPIEHLSEGWSGTALDILRHPTIPPRDKFWVVCREDLIDAKTLRLFAVWCARQAQHLMTDPHSIAAIDVAEKFANGEATEEELAAARHDARAVLWPAPNFSVEATSAASAAVGTTQTIAADGAWNSVRDAWAATWSPAIDVWSAQVAHLIEMLCNKEDKL